MTSIICGFSVEREASKNIEENERECFKDAIVSSRSLNKGFVEPTKLKNAIREVPIIQREITARFYFTAKTRFPRKCKIFPFFILPLNNIQSLFSSLFSEYQLNLKIRFSYISINNLKKKNIYIYEQFINILNCKRNYHV